MNRRRTCLVFLGIVVSLLIVPLGCTDSSDRKPLTELMETMVEAGKVDYQAEIKTYPREEWAVRRGVLTTSRDMKLINDFLVKYPNLSEQGEDAVEALLHVYKKRLDFFESVVKMGRFKLTEAEKEQLSQLMQEHLQRVNDIGRIINGKSR